MSIACCTFVWACGSKNKNNMENKDPLTGQEQNTQMGADTAGNAGMGTQNTTDNAAGTGDEFDRLLAQENNAPGVIDYINRNIAGAASTDVNRFFKGLLGYGSNIRDIDFTRLEESRQHMPEDMIAFMELMKLEKESPSMVMSGTENRMTIGLTLSEMLERALLFEQHIEKYPNHASTEAAERLYEELATHAITGGYDRSAGIEHYYKGEKEGTIDRESISYYRQFAAANQESRLGKVVAEYAALLEKHDFQINEELENFYHSIYQRLQPQENENTAGINNSTNNGAVINGTTTNSRTAGNNTTTNNTIKNGAAKNNTTGSR